MQIVQRKFAHLLDHDCEVAVFESLGLESDLGVKQRGREEVSAHEHVVEEDALDLGREGVHDFEFQERLKTAAVLLAGHGATGALEGLSVSADLDKVD